MALAPVALATVAAGSLLAFPQLHDEDAPLSAAHRVYAVRLVAHEHHRVASLEGVLRHFAVGLERLEGATGEVAAVRQHHVDGDERAMVVVVRERQRPIRPHDCTDVRRRRLLSAPQRIPVPSDRGLGPCHLALNTSML